jgi:hypothetical protein
LWVVSTTCRIIFSSTSWWWCGGCWLGSYNGGRPRISLTPRQRSVWCMSSLIWLQWCFWKALLANPPRQFLPGDRWTPLGNSCLEIAGSGAIRSCAPMFFL